MPDTLYFTVTAPGATGSSWWIARPSSTREPDDYSDPSGTVWTQELARAERYRTWDAAQDAMRLSRSPSARIEHRATDWTYRPSPMEQEPRPIVLDELDAAPRCTCDLSTPTHDPDCPVHQPVFTFDVTDQPTEYYSPAARRWYTSPFSKAMASGVARVTLSVSALSSWSGSPCRCAV